jgi:hypothetical protein
MTESMRWVRKIEGILAGQNEKRKKRKTWKNFWVAEN